jgi:hypothetical protein
MEVGKTGTAMFELDPKGRPQVFYYGNIREPASFEAHTHVSASQQLSAQPVSTAWNMRALAAQQHAYWAGSMPWTMHLLLITCARV